MSPQPVTVRIFGSLRPVCEARGLGHVCEVPVAEEGASAKSVAESMGIPTELIEGVFVNHTMHGLAQVVMPGDRVAFVPYDTPGPHRFFLGIYQAGKEECA